MEDIEAIIKAIGAVDAINLDEQSLESARNLLTTQLAKAIEQAIEDATRDAGA